MSYQEKNITVSLVSHLFIMVYYLVNLFPIVQSGEWIAGTLYGFGNRDRRQYPCHHQHFDQILLTIVEALLAKVRRPTLHHR